MPEETHDDTILQFYDHTTNQWRDLGRDERYKVARCVNERWGIGVEYDWADLRGVDWITRQVVIPPTQYVKRVRLITPRTAEPDLPTFILRPDCDDVMIWRIYRVFETEELTLAERGHWMKDDLLTEATDLLSMNPYITEFVMTIDDLHLSVWLTPAERDWMIQWMQATLKYSNEDTERSIATKISNALAGQDRGEI